MKLAIITAHAGADSLADAVNSWLNDNLFVPNSVLVPRTSHWQGYRDPFIPDLFIEDGADGMLSAYQRGLEKAKDFDVLAYLHDDTIIHDKDWLARVLKEFEDPQVGLVGFGGALGHGSLDLYKSPYQYQQLGRSYFLSNMRDAENHGERFTGSHDVAVLDGFSLIIRRDLLEHIGGWPLNSPIGYVCYDYDLCCRVRRAGYRIRVVGVACDHLGGRTFVRLGIGKDPKYWTQFLDSHRYVYDTYRDVLPYVVAR